MANNGCGSKHFKLGCWIIGLVLAIVVTLVAGSMSQQNAKIEKQEPRIRENTEGRKVNNTRFEWIQESLKRIERGLEKGDTP